MTRRKTRWAVAAASIFVLVVNVPAWADSAKPLGKFGEWSSYAYTNQAGKVCYMASQPKRTLNAPAHRGETYFSVTDRTSDRSAGVISVTEGYVFKKDATAEIDIDGAKFSLYTAGDSAWSRNDKDVVLAMAKGKSLLVYGTPAVGRQVVDTYSLDGFGKALAEAHQACGLK